MADSYAGLTKGVTNTSGTGTYTVTSPAATLPYRSFAQAVADGSLASGDIVHYVARDSTVVGDASFESGEGTFTVAAGPTYTVTRTTIYDGANGPGVPVSWGLSGQRDIYLEPVDSSVAARIDRANTFTQDQTISKSSASSLLVFTSAAAAATVRLENSVQNHRLRCNNSGQFVGLVDTKQWLTVESDASVVQLDPVPTSPANGTVGFFRNCNTAGTRALNVYKGDGSATVMATIDPNTGAPTFGDGTSVLSIIVQGTSASLILKDADASADNKYIQYLNNAGKSTIRSLTDALSGKYEFFTLDHSTSRIGINSSTPSLGVDIRADVVINDAGANNIGLRVEGDTDTNLLVTDPANDRVYIGGLTGSSKLNVTGTSLFNGGVTINDGLIVNESGGSSANLRAETQGNANAFIVETASDRVIVGVHLQAGAEFSLTDGVTAPTTVSGRAFIYVDTADGDLKVKFGDGTVKTIATDT